MFVILDLDNSNYLSLMPSPEEPLVLNDSYLNYL